MSEILIRCLAVGAAGSAGSLLRWGVGNACKGLFGVEFPIGTLLINITGSFFLGWFSAYAGNRIGVSDTLRIAIAIGFVGAYTTFSTYMLESNELLTAGAELKGFGYLAGSILLGLLAVRAGIWLGTPR